MRRIQVSRRAVLRGLGTAIALPTLESLLPRQLWAKSEPLAPVRAAFVFVPNGVQLEHWTPKAVGPLTELPKTLAPLQGHRDKLLVLSGLGQANAAPKGDGAGDHARSAACFLTGAHPVKTAGSQIRVGVSVDQVAAAQIGRFTPFPSLELGCEQGSQVGSCDSGYSCAYSSNISWRSPTQPMTKETNPRLVFERLFGDGPKSDQDEARARRDRWDQSILDMVREDAARLERRLGKNDRRKLDEYLTAVRELERRLTAASTPHPPPTTTLARPEKPNNYREHIRLMYDLIVVAFQANLTRVTTMMLAGEGSNRAYPLVGVAEGHHDLSHHGRNKEKCAKLQKIDQFHIEQFAYFLNRLESVKEGSTSVLDQTMILYGSGIGDGDRHNHDNLPILLAGLGGKTIQSGRHLKVSPTPLNNLFVSMLDRLGARTESIGDSTGRLALSG